MTHNLTAQQIESIEAEIAKQPQPVQDHYWMMVRNGESPRFSAMCAMRQTPATKHTDQTFNTVRRDLMETMNPKQRAAYLRMAKSAGIPTQGKFYVGGLGRPTDPTAWVSTVDEAKEVCKIKNMTATGLFEHKGDEVPPPKPKPIAPDIADAYVDRQLRADEGLAAKCAKDPRAMRKVRAEVIDRHAPSGKRVTA